MHIDPYERNWMIVSIVLLLGFATAIAVAAFAFGIQVPSPEQRVDPRTVAESGPWAEPGLRELSPGKYEAYILARTWLFQPREITVPVGSKVTFYVTSADVQHGFKLQNTNLNVQVIPGQVSKLTITFDEPGDYNYICTEYCGNGHAAMFGTVHVTP
ncbi:MAG: cytochrome C oxidase subunit II [Anaerolineae bacterium]|nr:MAG: cytochrome C oxidase subunit II [Anaerolineae bacterium]